MAERVCTRCEEVYEGYGNSVRCAPCRPLHANQQARESRQAFGRTLHELGCSACAEDHPFALEVHHLCKGAKRFGSSRGQDHTYNLQDLESGAAIVLCCSCHSIFHRHFGGKAVDFPDQTTESTVAIIALERNLYRGY